MEFIIAAIVISGLVLCGAILYNHYEPKFRAKVIAKKQLEMEQTIDRERRRAEWQAKEIEAAKQKSIVDAEKTRIRKEVVTAQKKSQGLTTIPNLSQMARLTGSQIHELQKQERIQQLKMQNPYLARETERRMLSQQSSIQRDYIQRLQQRLNQLNQNQMVRQNPLTMQWEVMPESDKLKESEQILKIIDDLLNKK